MRDILFKAKRMDNGEWVEGYYQKRKDVFENDEHLIFRCESYHTWEYAEINPETICQYTGLTDKNGNKIWENDIVTIDAYSYIEPEEDVSGVIAYSDAYACFGVLDENANKKFIPVYECTGSYKTIYHVIGNIFDTPELLENE